MFGRRPPDPRYSPYVQTYIIPEVQTVQTQFVKYHVFTHVNQYPHTLSFENKRSAYAYRGMTPAEMKGYHPGKTEYPYKNHGR